MRSPSRIDAARKAADRSARIRAMAEAMAEAEGRSGACQFGDLQAAGFTAWEINAYADEARAVLSGRPGAGKPHLPPGRVEGLSMVRRARQIRKRKQAEARHAS